MKSSTSSLRFLFIGRPTRNKGLPDLLVALSGLPSAGWRLTVAGEWDDSLLPEPERRDPRYKILGAVAHGKVPGLMADSDAVVVPSRYENFCNVALEAMAAGRAVIGARCGGIPDLVEDGETGLLFEPGSVPDLRLKLRVALDHPRKLSRMGALAWQKARYYSWERVGRTTDVLFRKLSSPMGSESGPGNRFEGV